MSMKQVSTSDEMPVVKPVNQYPKMVEKEISESQARNMVTSAIKKAKEDSPIFYKNYITNYIKWGQMKKFLAAKEMTWTAFLDSCLK